MNIVFIILSFITTYIGVVVCNNVTEISAERVSNYCYYCSSCPRPFNLPSPYVTTVPSNTGWCAMMSATSSPDGVYTRGVAQPGLCFSNGCSWKTVAGRRTWVCCCNQDLCNSYVPLTCYYCSTCPRPFRSSSTYVTRVSSNTGWCAKMSSSSLPDGISTRGIAQPGLCFSNGCSWRTVAGRSTWSNKQDKTIWNGTWYGSLTNYPMRLEFSSVNVLMEIGPYPTSDNMCTLWRTTYSQDEKILSIKDYRLCRGHGDDDVFIDEGNDIKLETRWIGDLLITPFKYDNLFLISITQLDEDILKEEIIMIDDKPAINGVLSLHTRAIQRLEMKRLQSVN
ncbi:unnamed protein product [Rotaria magnacalcarata]|uniref:Uncharacterized protein n=1 Tax=Rotaria magnacalcarata TaxID=392030 RepID=A0A817APL0_9BILA|nr:unnamed protein product [Rotaria magnacalcarata]